ncbi:MAG TPA: sigma-70 family RNA polymerase sigma factor [Vicinamibacteria bacterium]
MADRPDTDLLASARAGDHAALEELLLRHQPRIYRFGMKMCRDPEDASDVLQDTLLAMARTIGDFRGASSISTWLYTITRSFCIKKRRRSKFAPAVEESLDSIPAAERESLRGTSRGPDEDLAGREVQEILDRAIATLDPVSREVLVLRDVEGLSAPEVAEVLGLRVEAVKSRLHRARIAIRNLVAPALLAPAETPGDECPDVLTLFSRHLEGDIGPDLCARMEEHLEECGRCRGTCDSLKRTLAVCRSAAAPEVPADVQQAVRAALRAFVAPQP